MIPSASGAVPLPAVWSGATDGWARTTRVPRPGRPLSLRISWLVLLLAFLNLSSALDPVENFCRRFGHQAAVIDRRLYIDGGFINYNPLSQYTTNYSNFGLHYHDLDTPGEKLMPQLYANLTKNTTIPSVNGGTLWADNVNKRFYLFGGEFYHQPPTQQYTLWSFDTIYNTWDSFGSPAQDDIAAVSYGAGVSVSETGEAYYYGGWRSNNTVPGWTGVPLAQAGLVKYSMDSNSWSMDSGPDSVGRAEGAMAFIPVGDGGMLVYFGGVQDPYGNGSWVGQPMESIFLFDVLSSKWYTQNASGTIPPMRRRFCAGATWAIDQSSYNIYLYGGVGMPPDTGGFDDVYVLTIPSFQWVKMYPTDGSLTGAYGHHSLSCNVIDGAQMMIIGGTFPTSDDCDVPDQYGVHNMDMGQQNEEKALWKIFVTNITQYAVPDPIIAVVGGSADGGATKTVPDAGFGNPDLSVLMTRKAHIPSRTPTRPPTPTVTPGKKDDHLSTGAIAGIAVGGAVALIFLALAVLTLIRRRRRLLDSQSQPKYPSASPHEWSPHATGSATYTHNSPHPHSLFLHHQGHHHHQHGNRDGNGYLTPAQHEPAELPVTPPPHFLQRGMTSSYLSPDGALYELVPGAAAAATASSSSLTVKTTVPGGGLSGPGGYDSPRGTGSEMGTGTSSSGNTGGEPHPHLHPSPAPPHTKIDSEGRVWVQVQHVSDMASSSHSRSLSSPPSSSIPAGRPSLKVSGGGGGGRQAGVIRAGFEWEQQQQQELGVSASFGGRVRLGEAQELSGELRREPPVGWDAGGHDGRRRHMTFYHP
ncbi:hypothetical protein N658DRAFT_414402 [Parathielavia hyrcaniae]|uniref:Cell wall anchored protein n=1 Tax=Parathielavia hyrcaniae TaxID=113614 RepID=A0AAN6QA70_9PEZI|nr:hypothetical protein N658DRAFT_414402 [Parathielavia hyrcaniae]